MEAWSLWEATLKFSLYCWLNFSWGHSKAVSKEEPSWARYTAVSKNGNNQEVNTGVKEGAYSHGS